MAGHIFRVIPALVIAFATAPAWFLTSVILKFFPSLLNEDTAKFPSAITRGFFATIGRHGTVLPDTSYDPEAATKALTC